MNTKPALIPQPVRAEFHSSEFVLSSQTAIVWQSPDAEPVAQLLAEYLRPATGFPLEVKPADAATENCIVLVSEGVTQCDDAGFLPEDYAVVAHCDKVVLSAKSAAGLARAVQTLRQLLPAEIYACTTQEDVAWVVPCATIEDAPLLRWRGLHIDVSRYFFTAAEVKRYIELMAQHRFNVLHMHLTDDQGWRVEIKKYPKLTETGSVRPYTLVGHERERPRRYDETPHGGFYTQDELRDIVAFAARRHVTVVPEIDMPGHMQAAVTAYPELGNLGFAPGVRCHWEISQHILNAEQRTVDFMCDVLAEVIDIFPSRFIHLGGDEAKKEEWTQSRRAQDLMIERGLKDEHELQSWFIRQIDAFITSKGRRTLGWDEILEGGLAPGAAVMSWRGDAGGIEAMKLGHDVVMANRNYLYLDYYQAEPIDEEPLAIGGMVTLEHVYAYKILSGDVAQYKDRLIGAQAQLWAEYISTAAHLDYMAYPRACAVAEIVWSPQETRTYADFHKRLAVHRKRLAIQKVNAHPRP